MPMSVHDCGFSGSDPLTCYGSVLCQPSSNLERLTVVKLIYPIPVLRLFAHISSVATTCMGVTCCFLTQVLERCAKAFA